MLLTVSASATETVFKIFEQEEDGDTTHRLLDRSTIGDGLDPVLQFILLEEPTDPKTAQVLWEASESPIPWSRSAEQVHYRMIEHAAIPDGSLVEYRIYVQASGNELVALRHMRTEDDGNYAVDDQIIDKLPDGEYNLHAHLLMPDRPAAVLKQRVDVTGEALDEPGNDGSEPIVYTEKLQPGNGWAGPTSTPKRIGNRSEPAIAHWNVVPEQAVSKGFTVGVIAHHLDGIDRVEIAANGGKWVTVNKPSVNPRTGCEEYWVELDVPAGSEDPIELRAIAYPVVGQPVLVSPLGSEYSKQDMTIYPNQVGAVIELGAGKHTLDKRDLPEVGWLVVRPKPGLSRDDVILVGESRGWERGRLKLENLTIELPWGGGGLMGRYNVEDKHQVGNHIWLDNCRIKGAKLGTQKEQDTWWITHLWETSTYTNCEISHISKVFFGFARNKNLVRNCFVHNIYEDVFNTSGLHVNVTIENLDRTPLILAQNLKDKEDWPHPDIWQSRVFKDTILQDITAVKNINAQGLFIQGGRVEDVAVVRANLSTQAPWRVFHPQVPIANWLIKDSRLVGGAILSRAEVLKGDRLVIDGVSDGGGVFRPADWDQPGVVIRP